MILTIFFFFLIPILNGSLIAHLLWPERKGSALLLKFSLGIGMGLGINSILYFLALNIAPKQINVLAVEVVLFVTLGIIAFLRERNQKWERRRFLSLSRIQWGLIIVGLIASAMLVLIFVDQSIAQPQAGIDAWSIWNRAARFISRDPENWRATLSPDLYWHDHADYPLLVPLNVAWGWQMIGSENVRVPMMVGAFFVLASIGMMFATVALTRTIGQASLATLVLMGTPLFVWAGAGQVADVPVMYFIFASSALMFLALTQQNSAFLILSGFMAGLAGWTKNEGLLLIVACVVALIVVNLKELFRSLKFFLAGLAIPLTMILYFKSIAPPSDLFTGSSALVQILDISRYWMIFGALGRQLLTFGYWPFSIFIGLAFYALLMQIHWETYFDKGLQALASTILLQSLGYFLIFLLTPHELIWQLNTSLYRLILQLYPSELFLFFSVVSEPEKVFKPT